MSDKVRALCCQRQHYQVLIKLGTCMPDKNSANLNTSQEEFLSAGQSTPLQRMLSQFLRRGAAGMGIPFASSLQEAPAAWGDCISSSGRGRGDRE